MDIVRTKNRVAPPLFNGYQDDLDGTSRLAFLMTSEGHPDLFEALSRAGQIDALKARVSTSINVQRANKAMSDLARLLLEGGAEKISHSCWS